MRKIHFYPFCLPQRYCAAQSPVELPLWPDGAPNTNGLTGEQEDLKGGRVANVTHPSITVYRPAKPNGMAVIMCPGGGYARLAMKHEGHDMAAWFTTQGITYAVLKYPHAERAQRGSPVGCQQAIRLVRKHAGDRVKPRPYRYHGSIRRRTSGSFPCHVIRQRRYPSRLPDTVLSRHLHAERRDPQRFPPKPYRRDSFGRTGTEILARKAGISQNAASLHHAVGGD